MAGEVCSRCGEVIRSGQKIVYEEGKPTHYPACPVAIPLKKFRLIFTDGSTEIVASDSRQAWVTGKLRAAEKGTYLANIEEIEVPTPSEVFPVSEKHKCFCGQHYFSPHYAKVCPVCEWLICPVCGGCACKLSPEAREAVEAVWSTYCLECRFRPHPSSREKIPLNMFLVWKAFGESAKKCASTLGVTVYDETYMPKIAECVAERMKGMTAERIRREHPEWVEEYERLFS